MRAYCTKFLFNSGEKDLKDLWFWSQIFEQSESKDQTFFHFIKKVLKQKVHIHLYMYYGGKVRIIFLYTLFILFIQ